MGTGFDKNNIANVYLFYGEETYKRRNYKRQLRKLIAGPGSMNYAEFTGNKIDFSVVYDSVVTMPFFAEKRLVIVEGSGKFKVRKKKSSEENDEKTENSAAQAGESQSPAPQAQVSDSENQDEDEEASDAMLEKILADLPPTTCLAFFEDEAAKNKRVFKTIASKGFVVECRKDTEEEVIMWLAKGFAAAGKNIRRSTAQLIVDRVGMDYDRLRQEYEKIIAYAGDAAEITDEDVLAITSEDIEEKMFYMLDGICDRDIQKVHEYYYGLVSNRVYPLIILAMMRQQFRTMLQVAECLQDGMGTAEIASRTGKRDFVIKKHKKYAGYFSTKRIEEILEEINDTDMKCKSGKLNEQIGVEMLLIDFSR